MKSEPATRKQLLDEVHQNWTDLTRLLRSMEVSTLNKPNVIGIWSPADLLNHLETWDQIAIRKLECAERGDQQTWWEIEGLAFESVHTFNEADVESSRARPLEERWQRLHETHETLVAKLEESPVWNRAQIYEDTADHYAHHIQDITHWLDRQKDS